ncbi:MAG: hypothetical protein KF878_30025 [Planctomycetes bacterium]|nr:hypothetical protein [Planctomycetota bacterium]
MTPKILSSFYTLYNNKPLPGAQYLANVLGQKYAIPPDRVEEATRIIIENARHGGFLIENGTEQRIRLEASGQASLVPPNKEDGTQSQAQGTAVQGAPAAPGDEDWSKTCFVITPIGADGSEERKHADMMLKHLLEPAMKEHGIKVVRADKIAQQGIITQQVFERARRSGGDELRAPLRPARRPHLSRRAARGAAAPRGAAVPARRRPRRPAARGDVPRGARGARQRRPRRAGVPSGLR